MATDVFTQWLNTGTVSQRSIDIYSRPDLFAQYERLERELAVAREVEKSGDRALGHTGSAAIEERIEALYNEWQASKMVWFIRALSGEELDRISDESDLPKALGEDATDEEKEAHRRKSREANTRSNIKSIVAAVVKIEDAEGNVVRESVTEDEMWAMRDQFGEQQVLKLVTAALVASTSEVAMPVPTSSSSSKENQS